MLCAKSLQSCLTLCDPAYCSPPGFSIHRDSLGKEIRAGFHVLLQGIFLTQESNKCLLCLLHWQTGFYHYHHQILCKLVGTLSQVTMPTQVICLQLSIKVVCLKFTESLLNSVFYFQFQNIRLRIYKANGKFDNTLQISESLHITELF